MDYALRRCCFLTLSHQNILQYAAINLNLYSSADLQFMKFAPVVGYHTQVRLNFMNNSGVIVYKTLADLRNNKPSDKLDKLLLSIEGVPLLGEIYTYKSGFNGRLALMNRMISLEDKTYYVLLNKYPTSQYRLNLPKETARILVRRYIEDSEKIGTGQQYVLYKNNCTNELLRLAKNYGPEKKISSVNVFFSVLPNTVIPMLKMKGLINTDQVLPLVQDDHKLHLTKDQISMYDNLYKENEDFIQNILNGSNNKMNPFGEIQTR